MKFRLLIFLILFSLKNFSQGINNLWLSGYQTVAFPWGGSILDFNGGSINMTYETRPIFFTGTNGVIADHNGNLLFCSNGVYIANATYDTMANGSGLNPSYYTTYRDSLGLAIPQGNIIIPTPGDTNKYYLFHETSEDYGNTDCSLNLFYSVIDMSMGGGLGFVIQKNQVLFSDSLLCGRLTACKHSNGRDWWLISHKFNSDIYYKFLITPFGILGPFSQNIGAFRDITFGQLAFSPNGKKFAYYEPTGDLDIMDFDRCTGTFSNVVHVDFNDSAFGGGVSFSPNSNVLYVSSLNYIYQFDLTSANIIGSQITVAVYDGFYSIWPPSTTTFNLAQLAPDGKIYIVSGNSVVDIHVINFPDSLGSTCDICQHCIHLPSLNKGTLPNHPNYFLGAETGSVCDSLTYILKNENSVLNFKIYPNPAIIENITFTYAPLPETSEITIFNIDGKNVAEFHLPQWSSVQHVKLPKLSSGIYLARFASKMITENIKFVVE